MKSVNIKSRFLTVILLLLIFSDSYCQDLLDGVKSNLKLVAELKDVYRAFHINNIIIEQKETINLFLDNDSEEEMKTTLDDYIKVCDSLKIIHFKNDTLNSYVSKYLAMTKQSYSIARDKGFNSSDFKEDIEKYKKWEGEYMDYLYSTYSTDHFISMTDEEYWQTNNKKNYIKSPEYETYKNLKTTNLKDALTLLNKISKQTTDFQEHSIYQIELADQYVKYGDSLGEDLSDEAIEIYKGILDQKKYSIYLFEAWLKWRIVMQRLNYGTSIFSEIPNNEYDKVREQVALTILDYIATHDKDEMAINEFLLMATHDIIRRFGDYPYGNQNTVEYYETFDDKK